VRIKNRSQEIKIKKLTKLSQEYKFDIGESDEDFLVIKSHMCTVKVSRQTIEKHRKSQVTLTPKDFDLVEYTETKYKNHAKLRKILYKEYEVTEILFDDKGDMVIKSIAQETKVDFAKEEKC